MATIYHYYYVGESGERRDGQRTPMLLTFSRVKNGPIGENKPHSHAYLEIFAFESGHGYFESGKKKLELRAGDFLVVEAGVRHVQYSNSAAPLVYDCFAVACDIRLTEEGFALVNENVDRELLPLVEACRRELSGTERGHLQAANAYFQLILIRLLRLTATVEKAEEQSVISRIKTYIEAHCDEEISLDALADRFYINKNTLLHAFKRELGTSPLRYRNGYRIERAKRLLATGMGVTEAALSVGFSNPVYFSELFRRYAGETPTSYQKQHAKW